jgi:hypothetical protein
MNYQVIAVDDWREVDLVEVLAHMPPGSKILLDVPSAGAFEIDADEPPKGRKH